LPGKLGLGKEYAASPTGLGGVHGSPILTEGWRELPAVCYGERYLILYLRDHLVSATMGAAKPLDAFSR
jgi:hypothetical protein